MTVSGGVGERPVPERDRFSDWPAPFRWAVYVLVVALVLALLAVGGAWWVARRSLPETDGALRLGTLDGQVVVRRDAQGVPQIYAGTSHDLFAAQGFVQAQDRFWQMDLRRHAASGQLAEIFGSRLLRQDEVARTLGWRRTAQRELALLDAPTRQALEAFSDGVNAYLDQHIGSDNSLEYTLVSLDGDYRPGDWTPVDSLAYLKLAAWQQAGGLHEEVQRAELAVSPAPAGAATLYPSYPLDERAAVTGGTTPGAGARVQPGSAPSGAEPRGRSALVNELGDGFAAEDPLVAARPGTGGTAFAVAGRSTVSGRPLLAAVPGQQVALPGSAYQSGLHCRRVSADCPYDVSGFAYAGLPGIVTGHNDDVSWAVTALGADTVDLFLESVAGGTSVRAGRREPLETRTERIRVAGGSTREITVRATGHGPLLSDVSDRLREIGREMPVPSGAPPRGDGYAVAVRWTGSTPGRSMEAVLAMDAAGSVSDVRAAARRLRAPASGVVYADRRSIGYQATGAIPSRVPGDGLRPAPGWASTRPLVPVPDDRLPHEEDPASGIVVAAGQPPSADTTTLGDSWSYAAKADRVRRLLAAAGGDVTATDLVRVATDTRSPTAPALVPHLLDVPLRSAYVRQGQRTLRGWDYSQPTGSAAAAYYNAVWRNLLSDTFHDQLPPTLWPDGDPRWDEVVRGLLDHPDDPWWDDATTPKRVEKRDDVLVRAMREARDEMTRLQARDPRGWSWGHLHRLELRSPALSERWLGRVLFDRDGHGAPGGPGAVMDTAYDPRSGYSADAAPAGWLVSDLADPDGSRWAVLGGTSGHVFGPHLLDQLPAWRDGSSSPWPSTPHAVRAASSDTLVLRPTR
ncbi:penicillin acylase family protein [Marmoricola endophyticus]|uniref:penicillin acylase family protein n=1 Tax=Marmoricola endophyticus TaxID=2040280 RepID=UPI001668320B|nr:penicillin acylase family protein [Marmoricola endophyticus]